jgi:hypothetical protein
LLAEHLTRFADTLPPMARAFRLFVLCGAFGLLVSLGFVLAFFGAPEIELHVPAAPLVAILLLAGKPLLDLLARRAIGPRGPLATTLALAAVAPLVAMGALDALSQPVVYSGIGRCGTPRASFLMMVPLALVPTGAAAMLVALVLVARRRALVERVVRPLGALVAAGAAVLLAASLVKAVRRPDPDHYEASLPIVTRAKAADFHELVGTGALPSKGMRSPPERFETNLGGAVLSRLCDGKRCLVELIPPTAHRREIGPYDWNDHDQMLSYGDAEEDETLEVRRDRDHGIWVLEKPSGPSAYVGQDIAQADVLARDVASSLSPPRGWIADAAGGLALAGLALLLRRRADRACAAIAGGRAGTLGESGVVTFPGDDHPVRVAPGQRLAVGPVVVLPGPITPGGVYRGDGPLLGARVACGSMDDLLAAARERGIRLDAMILALVALAAAPLAAACFMGIVI